QKCNDTVRASPAPRHPGMATRSQVEPASVVRKTARCPRDSDMTQTSRGSCAYSKLTVDVAVNLLMEKPGGVTSIQCVPSAGEWSIQLCPSGLEPIAHPVSGAVTSSSPR